MREQGYNPRELYERNPDLHHIIDFFKSDFLNLEEPTLYQPIYDALIDHGDRYFLLADFRDYVEAQQTVDETYRDPDRWARMCIMNIANMGAFSSDRTIRQYAEEIWGAEPGPSERA